MEVLCEWLEVVGVFVVMGESYYLLCVFVYNFKYYLDFVLNCFYKVLGVMDIWLNIVL